MLVDHPVIKWLLVIAGIGSLVFGVGFGVYQYWWHLEGQRATALQEHWLGLDRDWNATIIAKLEALEATCGQGETP